MNVTFLKPDEVTAAWHELEPEFQRVVDKACHNEYSIDHLLELATSGRARIGVVREEDGTLVMVVAFEFILYPAATAVNVLAMAGRKLRQVMDKFLPPFKRFCEQAGAEWIECAVSPGMERMHHRHGFKTVYRNLRLNVKE